MVISPASAVNQSSPLPQLESREAFETFQQRCVDRWENLWSDRQMVVSVGVDSSSLAKGADEVLAACRRELRGIDIVVREVSGNGAMWMEPWIEIKRPAEPPVLYGNVMPAEVPALLAGSLADRAVGVRDDKPFHGIPPINEHPFFRHQQRIVLRNVGEIEPESIEDAIARGAYSAYLKVLFDLSDEEVIAEVTAANLRGRGGAGFPAGIKWESGRKARARPKYVVCNSHEGEPNVYKDRRIHEGDPHRILEGILIACIACGAERGYNYIGGEYPLAIARFRKAVADAVQLGLIGEN
ncbi:MAG TPA: NADH-quinone oxidoreductase subunit F, partial [Thermomicrobiales bacterium]|nr:NADH-quinone oxidoreductase subunit F [Thermomicrobiales bacterium]